MYEIKDTDLWEALGRIYLKDFEIMEYYREGNSSNRKIRKKFVCLIKRRLFEDIWEKMQQYNETTPPFLEKQSLIQNECRAIIKEVEDVKRGRMVVNENSFIIYINKDLPHAQKRTVVAHELGHTFLYDHNKYPLEPYYRRKSATDMLFTKHMKKDYLYEYDEGFVYEIGRFLLIPSYIMEKYIPRIPSIDNFMKACEIFKVTKEIMTRRLFWDTYDWDSEANYWKDAFLILYPKVTENNLHVPKGNKEVFRGYFFRKMSFKINKIWSELVPILRVALERPEELITSDNLRETWKSEPLEYKGIEIRVEMKSTRDRIYIVGAFKNQDLKK